MEGKAIKIKVCGMRDKSNIRELVRVHPDYIGFIFYGASPRFVGEDLNPSVLDYIPESISRVGVFVNADKDYILQKINLYALKFIQLHGGESPAFCREMSDEGIAVIKAFHIGAEFDFNTVNPFKPWCKYFLFDTKCSSFGGSGRKFQWDIFEKYDNEIPVFLSGGIGVDDTGLIRELDYLNLHAVDINSRFEKSQGIKNIQEIRKFIRELKSR
jgi:phosphoribosylanthranilate isomerase